MLDWLTNPHDEIRPESLLSRYIRKVDKDEKD
jgi:hypothetical protein